jgi:hypothetical protein
MPRCRQFSEDRKEPSAVRDLLHYDERGSGVFQFRRGLTDTKQSGLRLLVFYEAVMFLVAHSKNNYGVAV